MENSAKPLPLTPRQLRIFIENALMTNTALVRELHATLNSDITINFSPDEKAATHFIINVKNPPVDSQRKKQLSRIEGELYHELQKICGKPCHIQSSHNQDGSRQFRIVIADIFKHIEQSEHPHVTAEYAKTVRQSMIGRGLLNLPQRWHMALTGNEQAPGDYFDVSLLEKLSDPETNQKLCNTRKLQSDSGSLDDVDHTLLTLALTQPNLIKQTAKALKAIGIRRIAYLGSGLRSLAFRTTPDAQGREQVLLLSPPDDQYIPNPLILPAIGTKTVSDGKHKLMIRMMPEVEVNPDVNDAMHVGPMRKMVRNTGLEENVSFLGGSELHSGNIGIYRYKDKDGKEHSVPMILDWGAVNLPQGANIELLKKQWQKMRELKPWHDACEHIRAQKLENIYSDKKLDAVETTMRDGKKSRIVWEMRKNGRYADEIGAAAQNVWDKEGDFTTNLINELNRTDPSKLLR